MAALSALIDSHEALHWTRGFIQARAPQTALHRTLETFHLKVQAGQDVGAALTEAVKPLTAGYADAISVANASVETDLDVTANAPKCIMRKLND